jgi:hypothetical protein
VLAVGDYAVGVWMGTAYDTFAQHEDVLRFRLEGSTLGRPRRVVQLGLPWDVREVGVPAAGGTAARVAPRPPDADGPRRHGRRPA